MKYTIRDLIKRLSGEDAQDQAGQTSEDKHNSFLKWTAVDDAINPPIDSDAPHAIVQKYIHFVTVQHALEYDRINEGVVRKAQMYREDLEEAKPTDKILKELLSDRELLIKKNRRLRRMAELSDDCQDVDKYCLEATVIRDLQHAIDFDEFKGCKATSIGDLNYGIIDWDNDWFLNGHLDRNISEAQVEKYEEELLALIDMKERTAWIKINLKINKVDAKRSVATNAVEEFKTDFEKTRSELEELKSQVLRRRLLERQIQEIKDDNTDLEKNLGINRSSDDGNEDSNWKETV